MGPQIAAVIAAIARRVARHQEVNHVNPVITVVVIHCEVDFVVCRQGKTKELVQVAYEIDSAKAFNRETSALVQASDALKCNELTLVCFGETRDEVVKDKTIHIKNALEWCV